MSTMPSHTLVVVTELARLLGTGRDELAGWDARALRRARGAAWRSRDPEAEAIHEYTTWLAARLEAGARKHGWVRDLLPEDGQLTLDEVSPDDGSAHGMGGTRK